MRISFDIAGLDAASSALVERFSERRLNAAVATTLTFTALDAQAEVKREMRQVFDRPTPYTMNSLFVRPATASRLQSTVYFKDDSATTKAGTPATKYLLPQVQGGDRRTKRFEVALRAAGHLPNGWFIVPGQGAKLDAYGNISRGLIVQVLSQLRIQLVAGSERNMSFNPASAIRAQRRAGGRFFVIPPGRRVQPGVYQREFFGRNITPVFVFVRRATYIQRLDFYGVVNRIVRDRLPVHIRRAIAATATRLNANSR